MEASNKTLPVLFEHKENCCGCSACFAICPAHAIIMSPDEEGFLYPIVNEERCMQCYLCLSVCVFKKGQEKRGIFKGGE